MPEVEHYYRLFALWAAAPAGTAAKEAFWQAAVKYLAENPKVYEFLGSKLTPLMIEQVELAIAKALAAQGVKEVVVKAASRLSLEAYLGRVVANYTIAPKIPLPQAQIGLTLAIALFTVGQAYAEGRSASAKFPRYQDYLLQYNAMVMKRLALAKQNNSVTPRIPSPKTFEEWSSEN